MVVEIGRGEGDFGRRRVLDVIEDDRLLEEPAQVERLHLVADARPSQIQRAVVAGLDLLVGVIAQIREEIGEFCRAGGVGTTRQIAHSCRHIVE